MRLTRAILALAASLCLAAPSRAQTFDEAVRANLMIALELCMRETGSADATAAMFRAAGFSHQRDDSFVNGALFETYHRIQGPADTVTVEMYEGQMAPSCTVRSAHIGAFDAAVLVWPWLNQRYPGQFVYRPPGTLIYGTPSTCPSFWIPAPAESLPYEIFLGPLAEGETCDDNRTVSMTPGRFP